MPSYIARRLLALIPTLFGVSVAIFLLLHLVPGDPARLVAGLDATEADVALIRHDLGLDQPLPVQYLTWIGNLLRGDMGRSTRSHNPVTYEIGLRLPATWELTMVSITIAVVIGLVAGITAATHRNTLLDYGSMVVALLGVCTPSFWLGLMLMLVFAVQLRWFPTSGRGDWRHLVLPGLTLGFGAAAIIARVTRSSLLEVSTQDYIRTATAKGLTSRTVTYRHAEERLDPRRDGHRAGIRLLAGRGGHHGNRICLSGGRTIIGGFHRVSRLSCRAGHLADPGLPVRVCEPGCRCPLCLA